MTTTHVLVPQLLAAHSIRRFPLGELGCFTVGEWFRSISDGTLQLQVAVPVCIYTRMTMRNWDIPHAKRPSTFVVRPLGHYHLHDGTGRTLMDTEGNESFELPLHVKHIIKQRHYGSSVQKGRHGMGNILNLR
jgi:hypothetical protein